MFRRLNGVAIVFHKLYGTQFIESSEANFSYMENDQIREILLKKHIYFVSIGEFVEGLDVGEILEQKNYDTKFKQNVIMESGKMLARAWLLSLKSEQVHENQPEKRVGFIIDDLHDGQIVFLSKRLNHLMEAVMIDFGAVIYIDRISTKTLIIFIKEELKIIDQYYSQKDFEFIINDILEEIDNTISIIEPYFLTETEFFHEAYLFRSILVQNSGV